MGSQNARSPPNESFPPHEGITIHDVGVGSYTCCCRAMPLHRAAAASRQEIDAKRRKRVQPSFSERSEAGRIPVRSGILPGPILRRANTSPRKYGSAPIGSSFSRNFVILKKSTLRIHTEKLPAALHL